MSEKILAEYDKNLLLYIDFTKKIGGLIEEILHEHNINVHSVTYRVKERPSLEKKLSKNGNKYETLADVTDITGIRITTYLEDDVNRIAKLIKKEFRIDEKNSVDKRALLDPDRFGYLSLHYVVSLNPKRCELVEYHRFPALKAEIQTRSILQHAWAEIEHDLGYKSTLEVPATIRRRFSRLAGLLELADQEFINIKNELGIYEKSVLEKIEKSPELVTIDKASLVSFIANSKIVKSVDEKIVGVLKSKFIETPGVTFNYLERMSLLGINTISELEGSLRTNEDLILAFASNWFNRKTSNEDSKGTTVHAGICIFYLCYVLAARTKDINFISKYTQLVLPSSIGDKFATEFAEEILNIYNQTISN